ncbi:hypothetical protein QEN19_004316 [Hanseniaspora menglaensis]
MEIKRYSTIYDKNYTDLSIERVTEIDSSVAKNALLNNDLLEKKSKNLDTKDVKSVVELLVDINKDTYFLLMNSSPLLEYQAVSNTTYNLFETKLNLLKQFKSSRENIEKQKRSYLETLDIQKKK